MTWQCYGFITLLPRSCLFLRLMKKRAIDIGRYREALLLIEERAASTGRDQTFIKKHVSSEEDWPNFDARHVPTFTSERMVFSVSYVVSM